MSPLLILVQERNVYRAARLIIRVVLVAMFIGLLTACGTNTPSLGQAPGKGLVRKAIALQVQQTQQNLTEQLRSVPANYEIVRVKLQQLEPIFLGGLPTYHFRGTYSLRFGLKEQQVTQEKNPFDVYLQRQPEGKTWRLVIPDRKDSQTTWRTYLISSR